MCTWPMSIFAVFKATNTNSWNCHAHGQIDLHALIMDTWKVCETLRKNLYGQFMIHLVECSIYDTHIVAERVFPQPGLPLGFLQFGIDISRCGPSSQLPQYAPDGSPVTLQMVPQESRFLRPDCLGGLNRSEPDWKGPLKDPPSRSALGRSVPPRALNARRQHTER